MKGKRNTSNSLSAAIRLSHNRKPIVLLGGDVGFECLNFWDDEKIEPKAQIIIFPHHGGSPENDEAASFAEALLSRVVYRMCDFFHPPIKI